MARIARRMQQGVKKIPQDLGLNLLIGKVFSSDVTVSTSEPGHPVASVTDQNQNTRWISEPQSPVNLTVDLGGVYDLTQLVIVFAGDTIQNYTISASLDGNSYAQIASGATNNTQKQTIVISSFSGTPKGRYLRLTGIDRWNASYGNSIWEIEAYGTVDSNYPVGSITSFTAAVASDTQVNLAWNYSGSPLTNFTLKRNGTTIASPSSGSTSYNNTGLTPGTSYTYTLTGNYAVGGTTNVASAQATTTAPGGSGRGWLSGVGSPEQGNGPDPVAYFSNWRGSPVEIGQTWVNTTDLWTVNPSSPNTWAGFVGPMSVCIVPAESGWSSDWSGAANGTYDSFWAACAQNLANFRAGKGTTYVAPFYEFNGDWMYYSVPRNAQGYSNFRTAWERMAAIWRQHMPAARIVLPPCFSRDVPDAMIPNSNSFDLYGGTIYNNWPWQANGATAMTRIEVGRAKAQSLGKAFCVTEWAAASNAADGGGGGDGPGYMTAMHDWFDLHKGTGAGQVEFETFFNQPGYGASFHILNPNGTVSPSQPNAAAQYQSLF